MSTVTLSLISHTNVGKTTLARTILRRDVGEVLDQAHVTDVSEGFDLVKSGDSVLWLWDTPGLGDSARLMARLRHHGNPLGWFLHQVWDRYRDRPLYSSQQAVRNIRTEADVVLYLVNAAEDPIDAGYVSHEMELLSWMEKPVMVLLNQTGYDGGAARVEAWSQELSKWPIVRDILPLDAFTRCWVQEGILLERVEKLLSPARQPIMSELQRAWQDRNLAVFDRSAALLGSYLQRAVHATEALEAKSGGKTEKRRAMRVLSQRLDDETRSLMDSLIEEHGLSGRFQTVARASLREDFDLPGARALSSSQTTILGAAMGGAAGGLVADVAVVGLSFGGGAVAGAILGAAGAVSLRRGYQFVKAAASQQVRWGGDFLDQLLRQSLLRYLAVAHFGRGRGEWRDTDNPEHWNALVEEAIAGHREAWAGLFETARSLAGPDEATGETFQTLIHLTLLDALCAGYPTAAHILRREPASSEPSARSLPASAAKGNAGESSG
ncbi:MAG: DUF3482 domain-containing protein [Deltaproteobacteria bacterium]